MSFHHHSHVHTYTALRNHTLLHKENIFSVVKERETNYLRNYNFTALPYRYVYRYIQK